MHPNENLIAVYSRRSRFTGHGESVGSQAELCREYIRSCFGADEAENALVFEDEGFSGGSLSRPAFKKMMEAARQHCFKTIIVYRLDRISRGVCDFSDLIDELSHLDIRFISIREQIDTSTPMGRTMMYMVSVFSQLERETVTERIRENLHELAKTGRWLGGAAPTGYVSESTQSISVDGKQKKSSQLKLVPKEADIIRKIYELYMKTESLTMTEEELLRLNIKTKTGRNYTRFSLKTILQNPVYLIADEQACRYFREKNADIFSAPAEFDGIHGILAYNRTDQQKGRAAVVLPESEWIISVGQHTGIIPSDIWISVQQSIIRNRSSAPGKIRNSRALLNGLLYCKCGSRMYPKSVSSGKEEAVFTYVCRLKERSRKSLCNVRNASGQQLDRAVLGEVQKLCSDEKELTALLGRSKKSAGNPDPYQDRVKELRREESETERKIHSLIDSIPEFRESSALSRIRNRIEELHHKAAEIHGRITELEAIGFRKKISCTNTEVLAQLLSGLRKGNQLSSEQKRDIISSVVRKVIWDGESIHMILFDSSEREIRCPEKNFSAES